MFRFLYNAVPEMRASLWLARKQYQLVHGKGAIKRSGEGSKYMVKWNDYYYAY
jgi:hypothetical protein